MNISENKQLSTDDLSLCDTKATKKDSNHIKVKLVLTKISKHIFKFKWIYLSLTLAISILLAIITTVNGIHSKQEKEIAKLFANKTFVTDINEREFYIREFNNKSQFISYSVRLTDNGKEIEKLIDFNDFSQDCNIEITFFGEKYFTSDGRQKIQIDKNNNVVSIGDYYPIDAEKEKMLKEYYIRLEHEENEKNKKENEEKEIKSYIPNKDEFYERVLEIFPEVKNWQLFGNTDSLYMDPYNSKNYCNLSEMPILIFNNGNNRIAFMKTETGLMISANGGNKLTSERYQQLIKLAFGNAPEELKICNLETFKKLTNTEEKAYPSKHSVEYKGITYEWNVGYKNGEQNSYIFSIKY